VSQLSRSDLRARRLAATLFAVARPLRQIEPNGIYHVTSRGNRRQDIHDDARDFQRFAGYVAEACERYELICHAYCFVPNHVHFVLQTPYANLSQALQWAKSRHAQVFNWRHSYTGHLFQGRFWSKQIKTDQQLVSTVAYVLRNPLEAGLCERAEDWLWSSCRASFGSPSAPLIPVSDLVLAILDPDIECARAKLRMRVYEAAAPPLFRLAA
jgi:putative transposase